MGVYYQSLGGGTQPLAAASGHIDGYGWAQSWRLNDDGMGTLWNAEQNGAYLFPWTPFVFVLDTKTMMIVSTEAAGGIDPLSEIAAINAANP